LQSHSYTSMHMKKIVIRVGGLALEGELNESSTAKAIWKALPFEGAGQTWGDEIYFRIPVNADPENAKSQVEFGDIGFWPPGNALCIFYGPTPASRGDEIIPASPVNLVGRMVSDVSVLKGTSSPGLIEVQKGM
jgi:hypothetical protein